VLSFLVQLGIHHIPATQALFQIGDLPLADCVLAVAVGLIPVTVIELSKLLRRMLGRSAGPAGREARA
jgi:Ca2+-transporting ATPase